MRRSAGFTLIELVIVIVILGILGAVAAPKLFNLQGDAYGANLNAMKSSISTGMTMANAKAQIANKGMGSSTESDAKLVPKYEDITFAYGYPVAATGASTNTKADWEGGILGTLENFEEGRYNIVATLTDITISPKTLDSAVCNVKYTGATKTGTVIEAAKVVATTDGC